MEVCNKFYKTFFVLHHQNPFFSLLFLQFFYFIQPFIVFNSWLFNSIIHLLKSLSSLILNFIPFIDFKFSPLYLLKFYCFILLNLSTTSTLPLPSHFSYKFRITSFLSLSLSPSKLFTTKIVNILGLSPILFCFVFLLLLLFQLHFFFSLMVLFVIILLI